MRRTHKALASRDLPAYNYSTHLPIVFNKRKLRETFAEFDPRQNARAVESLYMNHHFNNPEKISILQYHKRVRSGWSIRGDVKVVNVGGFNQFAENVIAPMFPKASVVE